MGAADDVGGAAEDVGGAAEDVGGAAVDVGGAAVDVGGAAVDVAGEGAATGQHPLSHGLVSGEEHIPQPMWLEVNGALVNDGRLLDAVSLPSSYSFAVPPSTTMQACFHCPLMMGCGESQMPGRSS